MPTEDCLVSLFGANSISEDATFISVCVQLDGPTSNDVFINYNTVPLTATGTKIFISFMIVMTYILPFSVQLILTMSLCQQSSLSLRYRFWQLSVLRFPLSTTLFQSLMKPLRFKSAQHPARWHRAPSLSPFKVEQQARLGIYVPLPANPSSIARSTLAIMNHFIISPKLSFSYHSL